MLKFNKQLQAQLVLMCGVGKLFRSEKQGEALRGLTIAELETKRK